MLVLLYFRLGVWDAQGITKILEKPGNSGVTVSILNLIAEYSSFIPGLADLSWLTA